MKTKLLYLVYQEQSQTGYFCKFLRFSDNKFFTCPVKIQPRISNLSNQDILDYKACQAL